MAQFVKRKSKSGLFLIELMIMILFFSVASAVCIQLFAKASLISKDSRDLSMATAKAQTAAEFFKNAEGSVPKLAALLETDNITGDTVTLYYGNDWQPCTPELAAYTLSVRLTAPAPMVSADILVQRQSADIYSLGVKTYIPETEMR